MAATNVKKRKQTLGCSSDRRSIPGLCVCELFALHSASLPPSVGVIVCVDESDHQFQSQSLRMDSSSMAGTPESRTHESTGRLIYTSSVHSAPLFLLCVILSPLLLKRTWITDAHTWYCHLLSLGESGNSVSLAQSYRSFVSAQTFPWLTTAWSSVWEGGKLKQERPVLILRYIKPLCAAFSPLLSQIWVKNSSGADVRGLQSWEYPSGVSGEGWPKERTVFFGL